MLIELNINSFLLAIEFNLLFSTKFLFKKKSSKIFLDIKLRDSKTLL